MSTAMPIDETESMRDMLEWFQNQPCSCATIGYISDETGWSRETIRTNLKQLQGGEYVERRHKPTALYRLVEDPRDG